MSNVTADRGIPISIFLPLLLGLVAVIMQAHLTKVEFSNRFDVLHAQEQQQEPAVQQALTLRKQLESIAGATAALAEQGNANAIVIRDQLKNQGISIKPPE